MRKVNFEQEFGQLIGLPLEFDADYKLELASLVRYLNTKKIRILKERRAAFIAFVNKKFDLNSKAIATLYAKAAKFGYTFNFHQKNALQKAFDTRDQEAFKTTLEKKGINVIKDLAKNFSPISDVETINHIKKEVESPSKLRIEKGDRDIGNEILKALFSAFLWSSLPEKEMHEYFDPDFSVKNYRKSFWEQLQTRSLVLFNRDNALYVVRVTQDFFKNTHDLSSMRNKLVSTISKFYEKIDNYGFLAVIIEPISFEGQFREWELASDFILAAEKFKETPLENSYFQWERIQDDTHNYIGKLDSEFSRFDLANEGFTYRDTFVLHKKNNGIEKLVLIFQKNDRDETLIPCPTCRSNKVQGNSYSSLGVKSWECNNPLCPDRSKYNRGKRYSFRGLLMQQAIENDDNIIPVESVRRWRRDVVEEVDDQELFAMLIRHYSMHKDCVHIYNWPIKKDLYLGRRIVQEELAAGVRSSFFDGHLFKRYVVAKDKKAALLKNLGDEEFQVYAGDATAVLGNFSNNTFDGAITSPPYFNAREYSQWPNIYCYLHDMLNINREVFRTLKPGSLYLYNIFDYFDNEKTTVFSAMGQKRMILSAYTVDLFRRIGFELIGNVSWDKGDIEGKRGFNAGNYSPFYQAPFNCWEHILVFKKPGAKKNANISSGVFSCKPVMKMIKGENTHGHTAPFPDALPEILISKLSPGSIVLDPFGGSLTTGRVAEKWNVRSVSIEILKEYCDLGLKKRKNIPKDFSFIRPAISKQSKE